MDEREIVYDMLLITLKEGEPSHQVLRRTLQKYQYLDKRQRAFISRLYRGVLEYQIILDDWIGRFVTAGKNRIKLPVRIILRMGVYQILEMDHVPDPAACNEAVKLAKKHGFRSLSGFVNGVLRNIVRFKNEPVLPDPDREPVRFLSLKYALPEWLAEMWLEKYDLETCKMMGGYMLASGTLALRVRDPEETLQIRMELEAQGVQVRAGTIMPEALRISGYDVLEEIPAFAGGRCVVQDESAMLAAKATGIMPGMRAIDVCAAPGGKSIHLADMMQGEGHVSARDLTPGKVALISENIQRCGITNVTAQVRDAAVICKEDIGSADVVMADLPCSGLGVIGKKPDIKLHMNREKIADLAQLQREILSVVWQYVRPGGALLFSTCTVSEAENEDNMRWFCDNFPFSPDPLDTLIPPHLQSETTTRGWLQILPGEYDSDGFFIARFKRSEENV